MQAGRKEKREAGIHPRAGCASNFRRHRCGMPWVKIQRGGNHRSPSVNVGFQQGGNFLRIPESCIKRAIGSSFNVCKSVLVRPFVDTRGQLILKPEHGNYSPTRAIKRQQKHAMLKAWKSNAASRQYYISAGSILRALEIEPESVDGKEYRTRIKSGTIVVAIERGALDKQAS
jgi:hypothetical protein